MPAQNFDIVMRVVGGKVAEAQLVGVADATEGVGAAQVAASKKSRTAAGGFVKHAAAIGALYGGYKLLKGSLSTTVDLTRNTLAFQRATGLDYKTAQAWVVTAEHRSISSKQLGLSMATLGRQLGSLTPASKTSIAALKSLGLSQAQLAKMPMKQRLDEIANAFQRMPNGTAKAAAAQRLFGRAGQGLLPILNQGAEGMNKQLEEAQKLVPATAKSADGAAHLMQQQRALNAAMLGVKVAIGSALIPILSALGTMLTPIATAFANLMEKSKLFRAVVLVLTAAIIGFMLATKILIPTLYALGVSEDAALGPIGLIVAGVAALVAAFILAYKHVTWFHNAVDAVVGFIKAHWRPIVIAMATVLLGPLVGAIVLIVTHLHTFINVARSVVGAVKGVFNGMVSFFSGLPGKIAHAVSGAFNGVYNAAWSVVHHILSMFSNMASSIGSTISNLASKAAHKLSFGLIGHKAEGGPVTQTGAYLVGERGPEVVTLTNGSTVVPNNQLGALAGGGGGVVHTHVYLDRKQIALAVGRYTSDQQKRR